MVNYDRKRVRVHYYYFMVTKNGQIPYMIVGRSENKDNESMTTKFLSTISITGNISTVTDPNV